MLETWCTVDGWVDGGSRQACEGVACGVPKYEGFLTFHVSRHVGWCGTCMTVYKVHQPSSLQSQQLHANISR